MQYHPDITQQVVQNRYAELLESARNERLAAMGVRQPEIRRRFVSVRGAVSAMRIRVVRMRTGLGHA